MKATGKAVSFASGTILFKENDPGGDLYLINSGEVEIFRERGGVEITLAHLGAGELLGTMTCTTNGPRTASARTLSETKVNIIEYTKIKPALKTVPTWINTLIKDYISRIKRANDVFVDSSLSKDYESQFSDPIKLAARVCEALLALGEIMAVEGSGGAKMVPLKRVVAKLNKIYGIPVEKLEEIIGCFKNAGKLNYSSGAAGQSNIPMKEIEGLQSFSAFVFAEENFSIIDKVQNLPKIMRQQLRFIEALSQTTTANYDDKFSISLVDLIKKFISSKKKYEESTIELAAKLSILEFDKEAETPTVHFVPNILKQKLDFLDIARAVVDGSDAIETKEKPRILIY